MRNVVAAFLVVLASPKQGIASPLLAAICDEPAGPRMDFSRSLDQESTPKLERSEDRYTDVNPFFVIDSSDPTTLQYVWGHTKAYGEDLAKLIPVAERRASIVISTPELVSAVEVYGTNRVSIFTLLPKLGFGIFTDHAYTTVLGENVKAVTFTADCKFLR
jgi:hypothetical protein